MRPQLKLRRQAGYAGWRRPKLCVSVPMRFTVSAMPVARRYFAPGQLQFITSSVYRRLRLFDSQRLRLIFVEVLREYRQEKGFLLIG
jgi:hypothetical protein